MKINASVSIMFAWLASGAVAAGCSGSSEDVGTSEDEISTCAEAADDPASADTIEAAAGQARVWVTRTGREGLEILKQGDVAFGPPDASLPTIDVDETQVFQSVVGFGGAMTDSSAWMLATKLSCPDRARVMKKLFSRRSGIGLSAMRQPIGASDFTVHGPYSYDEGGDDPQLKNFSIAHDTRYIIPLVLEAKRLNPELWIVASPWSPPAWMKTNRSLANRSGDGKLRGDAYGPYAEYLVRFLEAYARKGVTVDAITPQNEPGVHTDYPGMEFADWAEADLLAKDLFPALARAGLESRVKVLGFDSNWDLDYPSALANDGRINGKIGGFAFHCYGGHPSTMKTLLDATGKDSYVTECTSASGSREKHGMAIEQLIRSMRFGARTFITWNLALGVYPDGTDGYPHQGWGCTDCIAAVTIKDGKIEYTRDFSDLGHASKFVAPGARRIHSNTFYDFRNFQDPSDKGGLEDVAFLNPDNKTIAVVAYNSSDSPITFQVRWHGQAIRHTVGGRSPVTLVWTM